MRTLFWLLFVLIAVATPVRAEELGIGHFVGRYSGDGPARIDPINGINARDDAIVIRAAADGAFGVTWSGARVETGGDHETSLSFHPAKDSGVWHAEQTGDPLRDGAVIWAYLRARSLTVMGFRVAPDGQTALVRYIMTQGDGALDLSFIADHGGRVIRSETGIMLEEIE